MATWLAGARPYALLTGLCLMLYLPGIGAIPPLDRDEARFAQATRQMLETGDFLRIRFQDEARNRKPAGIYWLQAASVALFSAAESDAIWPYRLPSLIGASAAVLLTFALGLLVLRDDPSVADAGLAAFTAAVVLAGSIGLVAEAHIAKTDAALLATIVVGQGALGLAYLRGRRGEPVPLAAAAAFWIAEAAGILIKGPIAPGLAALTALGLAVADRQAGWVRGLRPVSGLLLLTVVLAPWLIAIERATTGQFLAQSLGHDFFSKLIGAQEAHGAPPLSYLLASVATFWPGSLFLVPSLVRGWRRRNEAPTRFLLAWLIPAWVVIELVPTKLPHYALSLYPALALLTAGAIGEIAAVPLTGWVRGADIAVRVLWGAVTFALAAALVALPLNYGAHLSALGIVGAALLAGAVVWSWLRTMPVPAGIAVVAAVFVVPFTAGVAPGLDRLWLSRAAAALVAERPPQPGAPLVAVGYDEPSLVFLLGTRLHVTDAVEAAALVAHGGEALVSDREQPQFEQAVSTRGLVARPLGSARGIDYANGHRLVLTLYSVEPG
jgi:4-amino-4-deoxy-L-arabinose transferase-like glycosyltransferase